MRFNDFSIQFYRGLSDRVKQSLNILYDYLTPEFPQDHTALNLSLNLLFGRDTIWISSSSKRLIRDHQKRNHWLRHSPYQWASRDGRRIDWKPPTVHTVKYSNSTQFRQLWPRIPRRWPLINPMTVHSHQRIGRKSNKIKSSNSFVPLHLKLLILLFVSIHLRPNHIYILILCLIKLFTTFTKKHIFSDQVY